MLVFGVDARTSGLVFVSSWWSGNGSGVVRV